jgi:hypothetical protein
MNRATHFASRHHLRRSISQQFPLRTSFRPEGSITTSSFSSLVPVNQLPVIKYPVDDEIGETRAISFRDSCEVQGSDIQTLLCTLQPNQILRTESASLLYSTDGVHMETTSGGGMGQAFKRYITGTNAFVTDFSYRGEKER